MSRFLPYSPDQGYLLPPSVKDELGKDHLCCFVHEVVEWLDVSAFEQEYSAEGGGLYAPALMLKVWLYAYALGITSARRLEQRIGEDLARRYLGGGARPDNWALSAFRRRHARTLNDAFTQVLELARQWKMGKLGTVAVDSTRIRACSSGARIDTEQRLRNERARLRRQVRQWQQQCNGEDPDEGAGARVPPSTLEQLQQRLASSLTAISAVYPTTNPSRLRRQRASGSVRGNLPTPLLCNRSSRGGIEHLITAQRVTQAAADNHSLLPLVEEVEQRCGRRPRRVLADAGFFASENLRPLQGRGIDAYVPDSNLARALNRGEPLRDGPDAHTDPHLLAMRQKLRSQAGHRIYQQRKALVEPVFGVLKQQRGMRQFRTRGLPKVGGEFTLSCLAYHLTRLYKLR